MHRVWRRQQLAQQQTEALTSTAGLIPSTRKKVLPSELLGGPTNLATPTRPSRTSPVPTRATDGALPHRAPSARCTAESAHHVWHRCPTPSLAALAAQVPTIVEPLSGGGELLTHPLPTAGVVYADVLLDMSKV